jgi:MFS family permease
VADGSLLRPPRARWIALVVVCLGQLMSIVAVSAIVAIITAEVPSPGARAKAMSIYTLVISGGASLGLIAGGLITEALNWHWIFFVNVPVGIVTVLGTVSTDRTRTLLAHGTGLDPALLSGYQLAFRIGGVRGGGARRRRAVGAGAASG